MFSTDATHKFDSKASSTYKVLEGSNSRFSIDYIGGEVGGERAQDTVSVI